MQPADRCCVRQALGRANEALLRQAIALSRRSREEGNHPFGAIVVDASDQVIAEATNTHSKSPLDHAEMNVLRTVLMRVQPALLAQASLYSSAEPCSMCAGACYWAGIGRVVYALSERRLLELTGNDPRNPTLSLSCREVFA
ncbi:MAG: nucleoside deaminase, partial [Betaproteobacteria bacterium]|nr:nucleoside deaminase [Betaproteobacteria bacterium]